MKDVFNFKTQAGKHILGTAAIGAAGLGLTVLCLQFGQKQLAAFAAIGIPGAGFLWNGLIVPALHDDENDQSDLEP